MGDSLTNQGNVMPVRSLRDRQVLDPMNDASSFTAFNTDTANVADSNNNILGNGSISFDKANTAANSLIAGIDKTIAKEVLTEYLGSDLISAAVFLSTLVDVASVSIRLGTDASNYSQWNVADTDLVAGWNQLSLPLSSKASQTGTGHDMANITYAAVLVTFDVETDVLTGILWDHLNIQSANN